MIVLMEVIFICSVLTIFGLILGSFAGATVWRLRARQLVEDKEAGEEYDKKEYKQLLPLTKATTKSDRSRCLHCHHQLAWYDLLPLVSWIGLRGKCRYCHQRIGHMEPLIEIGMALFFVGSYLLWPEALDSTLSIAQFVLWLVAGVLLAILFVYDLKWFLLPNQAMFPLVGVGVIMAILHVASAPDAVNALFDLAGAVAILSGLYYVLWKISKGAWIGFGDVKLGLALALLLGQWQLAFFALFTANLIGCLIVIPGMMSGKVTRTTRIPFGPLLILGTIIAWFAGPPIIQWYLSALF